jgi:hypothetical protein
MVGTARQHHNKIGWGIISKEWISNIRVSMIGKTGLLDEPVFIIISGRATAPNSPQTGFKWGKA